MGLTIAAKYIKFIEKLEADQLCQQFDKFPRGQEIERRVWGGETRDVYRHVSNELKIGANKCDFTVSVFNTVTTEDWNIYLHLTRCPHFEYQITTLGDTKDAVGSVAANVLEGLIDLYFLAPKFEIQGDDVWAYLWQKSKLIPQVMDVLKSPGKEGSQNVFWPLMERLVQIKAHLTTMKKWDDAIRQRITELEFRGLISPFRIKPDQWFFAGV